MFGWLANELATLLRRLLGPNKPEPTPQAKRYREQWERARDERIREKARRRR